jgi:hypothetical protein
MKTFLFILFMVAAIPSIILSENNTFINMVGYNNGLSYRKLITDKQWIGVVLNGNYGHYSNEYPDTTQLNNIGINKSTHYGFNVTVNTYRDLFYFSNIILPAFISSRYSYSHQRNEYYNSINVDFGIAPKAIIFKRASLEINFGIGFSYSFNHAKILSTDVEDNSFRFYSFGNNTFYNMDIAYHFMF